MLSEDEQSLFRESVRSFAAKAVAPIAGSLDQTDEFPHDLHQAMSDYGLVQLAVPSRYGGPGADITSICIAREEVGAAGSMAMATLAGQNNNMVMPLLGFGTAEQKERLLPELAKGGVSLLAFTEAEGGSDPNKIATTAVRHGDEWLLNGQKSYISWGKVAQFALILARTGGIPGGRGLTAFITETSAPGFIEDRHNVKMGQRGLPNVDLRFDNLRVPHENILGGEGQGLAAALRGLQINRPAMAAIALGGAQGALDYAVRFVLERQQHGRSLARHQGLRWMIADMATKLEAARRMVYGAAAMIDQGAPAAETIQMSSMAKYFATEVAVEVTSMAVQLLGGAGYLAEHPVERYLRDVRVATIYEGTSEIQKNTIARGILGKETEV
ncbi:acyl-CoA dehydrogenase family protein [Frankia sp. Cas3]|uniref:acyl-CoA dehydrogenase family protein n=1 Tax=Frankia sp. Cas3 TaxID=3073926 RepID=UPI002AD3155E|nr:acyl-CoA dehydrogenase family protein [Frankia sp. Cas3]